MIAESCIAGLIGHPVTHSISPDFQQAAFDALGIEAHYERWDTLPELLAQRIASLRQPWMLGANVTVPHKEVLLRLVDDVDAVARRAGAVNTVCTRAGKLSGSNTDVIGFRRALREAGGYETGGCRAVVLGAGGAARAVVLALEAEGASRIAVANRHPERAARLARELRTEVGPDIAALTWEEAVSQERLRETDLLVNCTVLGLAGSSLMHASPVGRQVLHERLFVCDIVANPLVTPLLAEAAAAGASTLGGLAMLVYQGAASFELWTERAAPIEVMMRAATAAMGRMAGPGKQA